MIKDAKWITCKKDIGSVCPEFRKNVKLDKPVKKAVLHATSAGLYKAEINGKRVSDAVLAPYWTSYKSRLQYQSYDVTELLCKKNVLSFTLGAGWACGEIGWFRNKCLFFDGLALKASLDVTYADGTKEVLITDESWDVCSSQITETSIYDGETVDRTAEVKKLGKAIITDGIKLKVVPQQGEFVKEHERLLPIALITTPKGEKVIDFGQNMAGYVEVKAHGKKGDVISLSHFEILDKDGNAYTASLRSAKQKARYVLSGKDEIFKPTFTFMGFRYIRIDEYPSEDIDINDFTAIAVHSDIKRTGSFSCGVSKINKLYENVVWGQKSNFVDVPTDCPQRDERLGWTGDAQVFCTTAAINFDVEKFFAKWLADMALEQGNDGVVPGIVPVPDPKCAVRVSSGWGDAATVIPWQMYLAYGNKKMLADEFDMMKKWVGYIRNDGPEEFLWLGADNYGDWLAPDADMQTLTGPTDKELIATAYYAYSTQNVINAGKALNKDVSEYEALYEKIKAAFTKRFTKRGLPVSDTQTACAVMIFFGLCEDEKKVGNRLAKLVIDNGTRLNTGFIGTPYLLPALSKTGHSELAYSLLLQEKYPSWLYSVNRGATTTWEHWDGVNEKGDMWRVDMNSFNHYAYGSVFEWVFGCAGGIKRLADGPAYAHIAIKPEPDRRLGFLNCGIDTRCGRVESRWSYDEVGGLIRYDITVPEKAVAEVTLPDGRSYTLEGGRYMFHTKA